MAEMFCFQCEQTAGGTGCTRVGVCGKTPDIASRQDELTCALVGLARAADGKNPSPSTDELVMQSLFATLTNVNFDISSLEDFINRVNREREKLGGAPNCDQFDLFHGETDAVSLRSTLLFGLRGMAAYAWHAHILGEDDPEVTGWLYKGLRAIGEEHTPEDWLALIMELGKTNLKCMELLDAANTAAFGNPRPATVSMKVEKGPFIVITGHDLLDLKQLLEQTQGKGVNVYTHGEMLAAHAYPGLNKYPNLKGHYGTAWQNQQKEFANLPAPILFTTNCLMPPKDSYIKNVFTTGFVAYPNAAAIPEKDGVKDFSTIIECALELGGWEEERQFTGINGGTELTTGFAHDAVMGVANTVIEAVKSGALKHLFLVGGCDGARTGRNYYTEFVKDTPGDTVVLTLACGKYRFNDMKLGELGGLPRLMDMGQCNDAYSAIQVALALAGAFNCGVNDLPLTLVLSWYEQKAVCILLTLLSLGVKNIYLGPSLPAFISSNVLNILVEKFNIKPISNPEADMQAMLA
jgi:hydroxylamine reductase